MSLQTESAFLANMAILLADNSSEEISPEDMRTVMTNIANSLLWRESNSTVNGTVGFATSPTVPDPTSGSQAASKTYVDTFLSGLSWQESVLDFVNFTSAEPGSPTSGDRYINTATGTSDGTSQSVTADYIYEWNESTWTETTATEGMALWDQDSDQQYTFTTSWVLFASGVAHNSTSSLQGGTSGQYYHLTSPEYTNLLSKAADETLTGSWTVPNLTSTGHISFNNGLLSKSSAYPIVEADKGKIIGVTTAATITLPLSSTLTNGWFVVVDNQISAGGTVTFAKNAGDSTGIMKHEGDTAETPTLESKWTRCLIWWDGTNFHFRGRMNESTGAGSGDVTASSTFGTDKSLIIADGTSKGVQSAGADLKYSSSILFVDNGNVIVRGANDYDNGYVTLRSTGVLGEGTNYGHADSDNSHVTFISASNVTDSGSNPVMRIVAGSSSISTRPLFHFQNHNSVVTSVDADGDWDFEGNDLSNIGNLSVATQTPSSASDTGTTGTITWDASYIYICTATDTWKRVAISTW